ncbi:MAG: CRISPR-associated endonuclease Cas1 [Zavarzinella sp.]
MRNKRQTSVSTRVAHLVGPGKIKILNAQLAFSAKDHPPVRIDHRAIDTMICYGPVGISDNAVILILKHNIHLAWLSLRANLCRGFLVNYRADQVATRLKQFYLLNDPERRLEWAKFIVQQKLLSQRDSARNFQKQGTSEAGETISRLDQALMDVESATSVPQLRGIEGNAARAWFLLLGCRLHHPWVFTTRTRRPPKDPVNALLSIGYTWLFTKVLARASASGLELNLGGLHDFRPGRASFVCDLIEPLRVLAVDRWVLTICNRNNISPANFTDDPSLGFRLQPDLFPNVLHSWEKYWLQNNLHEVLEAVLNSFLKIL